MSRNPGLYTWQVNLESASGANSYETHNTQISKALADLLPAEFLHREWLSGEHNPLRELYDELVLIGSIGDAEDEEPQKSHSKESSTPEDMERALLESMSSSDESTAEDTAPVTRSTKDILKGLFFGLLLVGLGALMIANPDGHGSDGDRPWLARMMAAVWGRPAGIISILLGLLGIWMTLKTAPAPDSDQQPE